MTSAAIYARVSSARQKKDQTIGSQTAALREHAAQARLDVPEDWVFEDEGHSGATLVRPALEALRDLVAQGCVDVVLCYSPDRLARKFAYQALLLEEFARAGVRAEFVKGPRGDTPEDQLLVQFQGIFAEYEKAQLAERYRRGKAHRARTGSVNVLSGAPFGYRYVRKTDLAGAAYEIIEDEAALVAEMFRRYADDGASIADLARWLTGQGAPTRTGKNRWDRSRDLGHAAQPRLRRDGRVRQDHGHQRDARTEPCRPPAGPLGAAGGQDHRPAAGAMAGNRCPGHRGPGHLRPGRPAAGRQQAVRRPQHQGPVPAAGPGRLLGLRIRLLPRPHHHQRRQQDLLLPVHRQRQLPVRARQGLRQQTGPRRLPRHRRMGPHHRPARRPALIRAEISKRLEQARTADPATLQRSQLEPALAKAATAITAMIEAYSEQLITIDELRTRMPHLRARQTSLRGQLDALDAQAADRDAYLTLAGDLEGFLAQLRGSAATATAEDRQRVLRLLVKDILIGPEDHHPAPHPYQRRRLRHPAARPRTRYGG